MSIGYAHLVLIFAAALLFLVLLLLAARRHWLPDTTDLQALLRQGSGEEEELYHHFLMPLLVYEDEFPSFLRILALVLSHFPLQPFLNEKGFRSALVYLRDSVFQTADRAGVISAMSFVVQTFRSDPEVEFSCRPHLEPLVASFLEEIEA